MQPREDDTAAVRKLQQYIASLDFGNGDLVNEHKDIYTFITETILAPQSTISNSTPPVDVLVYAAKNILFPSLAEDLIPQLLDIIAAIEFYRQRALTRAKKAIQRSRSEDKNAPFNSDEEAFLKQLDTPKDSWRKVYMTILCKCCQFDLYHLWTANPSSVADFMIRFNEYFPFLNNYCTHESPRLLHQKLSTDEQSTFGEIGLAICGFGYTSAQWITDNAQEDKPYWTLFDTKEFQKAFPPPCAAKQLVTLICKYVDYVAHVVLKVDSSLRDTTD
ncbi:hypothetical protein F5887DRAFT_644155 [Amanita rubescens]|nr:hypothetical protein F5887DRAFT_644155 [Amanita rubescens]